LLTEINEKIQSAEHITQERIQEADATASKLEDAEQTVERVQTQVQQIQGELAPKTDEKERVDELFQANKKELLSLHVFTSSGPIHPVLLLMLHRMSRGKLGKTFSSQKMPSRGLRRKLQQRRKR
jgi:hypothetical protein